MLGLAWSVGLVVDGILTGVTSILSFVPQLLILFFMIDILEASGYMSRIAFFLIVFSVKLVYRVKHLSLLLLVRDAVYRRLWQAALLKMNANEN